MTWSTGRKRGWGLIAASVVVIGAVLASGCGVDLDIGKRTDGSGTIVSEDRPVSGFDRIELSGSGILEIKQGSAEKLTVSTDDNLIQYITTKVQGDTLEVRIFDRPGSDLRPTRTPRLELTVADLTSIDTSGSFEVISSGLEAPGLTIDGSGSCRVHLDGLRANELTVDISGSGELDIDGRVEVQRIDISGSGSYRAGDLETADTRVSISGSGYALVWATESLHVDVSGSGRVEYWGDPAVTSGDNDLVSLGERD